MEQDVWRLAIVLTIDKIVEVAGPPSPVSSIKFPMRTRIDFCCSLHRAIVCALVRLVGEDLPTQKRYTGEFEEAMMSNPIFPTTCNDAFQVLD